MKCPQCEERLSEYMDRTLPASEMGQVAEHLHECANCSALLEEMRSVLLRCRSFPSYEPETALIERVLLRTTGRPRWAATWKARVVLPVPAGPAKWTGYPTSR